MVVWHWWKNGELTEQLFGSREVAGLDVPNHWQESSTCLQTNPNSGQEYLYKVGSLETCQIMCWTLVTWTHPKKSLQFVTDCLDIERIEPLPAKLFPGSQMRLLAAGHLHFTAIPSKAPIHFLKIPPPAEEHPSKSDPFEGRKVKSYHYPRSCLEHWIDRRSWDSVCKQDIKITCPCHWT